MSKTKIIALILAVIILVVLVLFRNEFINWLYYNWLDIVYAIVAAVVAALLIKFIYDKYSAKSKMAQTTITPPSETRKYLAKLVLKNKHEFLIKDYERIFGREDFLGTALTDDLMFIGKEHFKITKMDDGFYIEDLGTKNGTMVNGEDITGSGKVKLENEDEIMVAKTLKIRYYEET